MDRITQTWCLVFVVPALVTTNNIVVEGDTDGSSEEVASVEILSPPCHTSPPHRPITCDVNTLMASTPPHPRRIHRLAGALSMSCLLILFDDVADFLSVSPSNVLLFMHYPTTESIRADGVSGVTSHLDKDYFEPENPWEDTITYF